MGCGAREQLVGLGGSREAVATMHMHRSRQIFAESGGTVIDDVYIVLNILLFTPVGAAFLFGRVLASNA
jgi:hypothetical protein